MFSGVNVFVVMCKLPDADKLKTPDWPWQGTWDTETLSVARWDVGTGMGTNYTTRMAAHRHNIKSQQSGVMQFVWPWRPMSCYFSPISVIVFSMQNANQGSYSAPFSNNDKPPLPWGQTPPQECCRQGHQMPYINDNGPA